MSSFGFFHHIVKRFLSHRRFLCVCILIFCAYLVYATIELYHIYFYHSIFFLSYLQIIYIFHQKLLLLFLSSSDTQHSDGESLTNMASSPTHSILFHGIIILLHLPKPKKPPCPSIINAVILPSEAQNSKSDGHPSLEPSHKFITSFSRRSQVLNLSIKTLLCNRCYKLMPRRV